jgi:rhomboid protease GluP
MDESEPEQALPFYQAATAAGDRDIAAAAYFGAGNALYRLDREIEARQAWEVATSLGETAITYRAWRQVAAALVREGDLPGALKAYRQCERRAPREDRPEIASRLGWLNKETGNSRAAGRYFARSRGDALPQVMTYAIIALTVVVSLASIDLSQVGHPYIGNDLLAQLELNKLQIAHGDYFRLLTVVLVHDPSSLTGLMLHLGFNMYALWYAGQLVERMYGSVITLAMYVICGIAGSVSTYVFGDAIAGVGASGAIFGLFGVVVVATRYHHAILDAQSRAIAAQIGVLIVLNLVIGFSGALNVDNFAHIGGLVAGMWLSFIFPPGQVATLSSLWQSKRDTAAAQTQAMVLRIGGAAALLAVLGVGIAVGTNRWQSDPLYHYIYGSTVGSHPIVSIQPPAVLPPAPSRIEIR